MRLNAGTVPVDIVNDHLVARIDGCAALIDTGSPVTFRAPELVSEQLREPIRWLVGTDQLRGERVLLDWRNRRMVVGGPALPGERIELVPHESGLYQIEVEGSHGSALAYLDSGAPLSYAPASVVRGLRPVAHQRDFMLGVGEYEVPVYELTVRVGSRRIRGRFGVLPELFAAMLSLVGGTRWILGSDFFRDRAVQLDFRNERLVDTTVVAARQRTTPRTARRADGTNPHDAADNVDISTGIQAWRAWRLTDVEGTPHLQSLSAGTVWTGPCFTADELPTVERRRAPTGIHAFATPAQLQSALRGPALVYGQVTLHGQVAVHETGYRAEHARVDRLFLRACGRHAHPEPRSTGLLLLDVIACQDPGPYCACETLEPHEWLTWEQLEILAGQLGDRYQCDVEIDAERPRIPSFACPNARRERDRHLRRA